MDIDIDTPSSFDPTSIFDVVKASMILNGNLVKHPCGVYFQNMPVDPISKLAAITHQEASIFGFTKIDFLHLTFLDEFENKGQIRSLLKKEPKWGLMLRTDVVEKLFQLHRNVDLVRDIKPSSILEIADCISLIRPGKLQLVEKYMLDRVTTRTELYTIDKNDKYSYKKGHAISYALIVVLQLHLIEHGIL